MPLYPFEKKTSFMSQKTTAFVLLKEYLNYHNYYTARQNDSDRISHFRWFLPKKNSPLFWILTAEISFTQLEDQPRL